MIWVIVIGGMVLTSLIGGNLLRGGSMRQAINDTQSGPDAPPDAFSQTLAGRMIDDEFKKPKY
jgi:hypothetical protein